MAEPQKVQKFGVPLHNHFFPVVRKQLHYSRKAVTMYNTISPPRIFVCNDIDRDPDAQARTRRIIGAYPESQIIPYDITDLPDLMREYGIGTKRLPMGVSDPGTPNLLLTRARFTGPDSKAKEIEDIVAAHPDADTRMLRFIFGVDPWRGVALGGKDHTGKIQMWSGQLCRPAWRLNTMLGCPHHCVYCSFGGLIPIYVNISEYCRRLTDLMAVNDWQKTYLYDDSAEALFPEPELGAVEGFIDCCRQFPDRYLIIHTKSANVDFLEDIEHRGRCIMTWSLTSQLQSTMAERLSATMEERIEAIRKVTSWGYPARVKFKPIVPFKGWRDHARDMVRKVLTTAKLDNISLFTIAWMDVDALKACFEASMLDPEFLAEAERSKEEMRSRSTRPYPQHVRAEIYRFYLEEIRKYDADVPVTLCTEDLDMWEEMAPLVGQKPNSFVCGCGPMATPGLSCLPADPWADAKPVSVWEDAVVS